MDEEVEDKEIPGLNLAPNSEDESEFKSAEAEERELSNGLSAARRRQLERALRRKQGRAGTHYYENVDVNNRRHKLQPRHSFGGGGGPLKRGRKSK